MDERKKGKKLLIDVLEKEGNLFENSMRMIFKMNLDELIDDGEEIERIDIVRKMGIIVSRSEFDEDSKLLLMNMFSVMIENEFPLGLYGKRIRKNG
tara:strand:- start:6652 stop:6939 length:288 start_codon:yes stop_codon:yes gene_type:complete